MSLTIRTESAPLTPAQMARGRRRIVACSVISMLFWVGLNDRTLSLFVLRLDPSVTNAKLALFFAIGPVCAVLTALMSPWVDLRGKKRLMIPFYFASMPLLLALAGLPALRARWEPATLVAAAAGSLTVYSMLRALGFAGWFPLINDNVPDETRGRFFGHLRTSWQLMLVVCSAAVGAFLGREASLARFQAVFLVGFIANVAMTIGMMGIPEAPITPPARAESFRARLTVPFRDPVFANFLLFGALYSLGMGLAGPFAVRCMTATLGAGDNFVVWMDTLSSVGAAVMLPIWGRIVDRFGGRVLFALLLPPLALINGVWLVLTPASDAWRPLIAGYSVLHGMFTFGIGVGITDLMLGSARPGYRSAYINISFVINALAVGLAPLLGAGVAGLLGGIAGTWGPFTLDANRWVFLVRILLLLLPLLVLDKLSRRHGGHVGESLQRLGAGLVGLLPVLRRGED
jgi:MFS family permease